VGVLPSGGSTWSDRRASNWCVTVKTDDVQKRNLESQFVELCTELLGETKTPDDQLETATT
jgi:hypothetical protein